MALQLTLSCDLDKTDDGPTLIHAIGIQDYKIPPEVIRILQENLSNDLLSDHEEGILCQADPQRILNILRQNNFNVQNQNNEEQKAVWTVVQDGGNGDNDHSVEPHDANPTPNDDKEADGDNEDQGGDDDNGENKEEGGGGGEEEEKEEQ